MKVEKVLTKIFECQISFKLAKIYLISVKLHYVKAKEPFEKTLLVSTGIVDRNGEASCYLLLEAVY